MNTFARHCIYTHSLPTIFSLCPCSIDLICLFLLSTFFFSHITQHPKYNKTKQQTHTQHLKVQSKGRERGKDNKNTKVTPLYNHVYQAKTLPSINGRRPGPTNSRRCTFTSHYLQEATDPICFSTHVRCKPVLYYCLLRSCKTSKQHSVLHWTYTETRIIIKKTQTWVKQTNQFTVMMTKPGLHVSIDWWRQDIPKTYEEKCLMMQYYIYGSSNLTAVSF